jgi:hypothetical protein
MTTVTGRKLDLLKCIAFDRKMVHYDLEVAFVILQHVNEKTGLAILSDEAIADLPAAARFAAASKPLSRGRPRASHLPRLFPAIPGSGSTCCAS